MKDLSWIQESLYLMAEWQVFLLIIVGFGAMYFGLAGISYLCTLRLFPAMGIGEIIDKRSLREGQIKSEITYSIVSILIFGLYGVVTLICDRWNWVEIIWEFTPKRFAIDLGVLFLWNEIHFYFSHRLLHYPWLYKHVHVQHHRSAVPTPFSTFSFHWFEATLLSSVMITCMTFYDLSFPMVFFFPVVSLTINNIGHMNYAIFPKNPTTALFASCKRHTLHHTKIRGNFGFLLPWLDQILKTRIKE